jgi:hypothetical protein
MRLEPKEISEEGAACLRRPMDACNNTQMFAGGLTDGRRIYIHERSLVHLAQLSEDSAEMIYGMLAKMTMIKIVHHIFEEDAVLLGKITNPRAQAVSAAIRSTWGPDIAGTLRKVGLKKAGGEGRLLQGEEEIAGTCYFSGYYTFATGEGAAARMFSDTNKISTVVDLQRSGEEYKDLTIIKGAQLEIRNSGNAGLRKNRPLQARKIAEIKSQTLNRVRIGFNAIVEESLPQILKSELDVIEWVNTLFVQAISKSIFAPALVW